MINIFGFVSLAVFVTTVHLYCYAWRTASTISRNCPVEFGVCLGSFGFQLYLFNLE
jgi:hypothetical protein